MNKKSDVIVLGAGIVGISTALHLQARGREVTLVDRGEPGSETSHGNAGLIERASVIPYAFPRDLGTILAYASNQATAVRYRPAYVARILPWLARYWWHSNARRLHATARDMLPLIERCIAEHEQFIAPSGGGPLFRNDGWIELYRSRPALTKAIEAAAELNHFNLNYDVLDADSLKQRELALHGHVAGAIHWLDPVTVSDPGAVTRAYADLFVARGGKLVAANALGLIRHGTHWQIANEQATYQARDAVIALGPWSSDLCRQLGYNFPIAYKRGYHMHYDCTGEHQLRHPVCDAEAGFVISPMARGIRLTTGIELNDRDAPPNTQQLSKSEAIARQYFSLGRRIDAKAWQGARPCLPDMKPIIGKASRHDGLWFNFGHAHHGFTLGPVTGRLLAEIMTGSQTVADPRPFAPHRFLN